MSTYYMNNSEKRYGDYECDKVPSYRDFNVTSARYGRTGLGNVGNTCYMNTALQCLSHISRLSQFLITEEYKSFVNVNNKNGSAGTVIESFAELIKKMWLGGSSAVTPRSFKSTVEMYATQFRGFDQHDSQEFFIMLLDLLHEDINTISIKEYIEFPTYISYATSQSSEMWNFLLRRNQSKIIDWFYGQTVTFLKCSVCGEQRVKYEPYSFITVPLPQEKVPICVNIMEPKYSQFSSNSIFPEKVSIICTPRGAMSVVFEAIAQACCVSSDQVVLCVKENYDTIKRITINTTQSVLFESQVVTAFAYIVLISLSYNTQVSEPILSSDYAMFVYPASLFLTGIDYYSAAEIDTIKSVFPYLFILRRDITCCEVGHILHRLLESSIDDIPAVQNNIKEWDRLVRCAVEMRKKKRQQSATASTSSPFGSRVTGGWGNPSSSVPTSHVLSDSVNVVKSPSSFGHSTPASLITPKQSTVLGASSRAAAMVTAAVQHETPLQFSEGYSELLDNPLQPSHVTPSQDTLYSSAKESSSSSSSCLTEHSASHGHILGGSGFADSHKHCCFGCCGGNADNPDTAVYTHGLVQPDSNITDHLVHRESVTADDSDSFYESLSDHSEPALNTMTSPDICGDECDSKCDVRPELSYDDNNDKMPTWIKCEPFLPLLVPPYTRFYKDTWANDVITCNDDVRPFRESVRQYNDPIVVLMVLGGCISDALKKLTTCDEAPTNKNTSDWCCSSLTCDNAYTARHGIENDSISDMVNLGSDIVLESIRSYHNIKDDISEENTLRNCMDLFTMRGNLDDSNRWFCPHCKDHVCAENVTRISKLPEILVVQLERFEYCKLGNEYRSYDGLGRKKINTLIDFPIRDFDLKPWLQDGCIDMEKDCIYDLVSICNHSGGASGGHYYCYACDQISDGDHWMEYNDSSVYDMTPSGLVRDTAYVLFYQRRQNAIPTYEVMRKVKEMQQDYIRHLPEQSPPVTSEMSYSSAEMNNNELSQGVCDARCDESIEIESSLEPDDLERMKYCTSILDDDCMLSKKTRKNVSDELCIACDKTIKQDDTDALFGENIQFDKSDAYNEIKMD